MDTLVVIYRINGDEAISDKNVPAIFRREKNVRKNTAEVDNYSDRKLSGYILP